MPASSARDVFLALEGAGEVFGLGYYGAFAANSMRLEKGYRAWGADLTIERTPTECGVRYLCKPDGRQFTGRDEMLERDQKNPWRSVLLEVETNDIDPFYSHPVRDDDDLIGIVTSGGFGHRTQKNLALTLLQKPLSTDRLSVEILGRRYPARVLTDAPFDPTNRRLKS